MNAFIRSTLVLIVGLGMSSAARGDIVFETGFEPNDYSVGQLAGQDGWVGDPIPRVQNSVVNGGTQAVAADAVGVTGQHVAFHALNYSSVNNPNKTVRIGVDFMTPGVGGNPDPNVYWDPLAFVGDQGFFGQVVIEAGTGILGMDGIGFSGPTITYNKWQRYEVIYDFGDRTMTGLLDGVPFATTAMINSSTDLTFLGIGINVAFNGSNSTGYWDNVSIEAIPAPGAALLAMMGMGMVGFVRRRMA